MSPQEWQHIWHERGWINQDIKMEDQGSFDDRGEEAYQRCFAEAIKENRVPNPSFFTNSPSAQAYIRNRDKRLFPGSNQDPNLQVPNPNFQRNARNSELSQAQSSPHSPASPVGQDPSSPEGEPTNGHRPPGQRQAGDSKWPSQRRSNGPLEPQVGPVGPPRMLR
ncbi:MAG: hypothetical protein Q9160_002736 [Pyrenula sp. 1 TL-2023]